MSKQKPEVTDSSIETEYSPVENVNLIDKNNKVSVNSDVAGMEVVDFERDEESGPVASKAKLAANSLKELIFAVGNKSKAMAKAGSQELKEMANSDGESIQDSKDINYLGKNVETIDAIFEETMSRIRQSPYGDQQNLLTGYKTLLEEQKRVIVARLNMAKRLAPSSIAYAEGYKSAADQ